jgi:hypothetical protein
VTENHERRVLWKLQRGLTAVNLWCVQWNINVNQGKTQAVYFSRRLTVPDDVLQLNGRDIPFVCNVNYLGVTFNSRMAWRHHIERTVAKALPKCMRTYSLFKYGRLSTNIKLTLYKSLIRSIMTYACTSWEHAADDHLLKLQRLQNRALCATGNLDRCTAVRELHVAFRILCVYDCINKVCRTQAEVFLNHANPNVRGTGQGEAWHSMYKGLNMAAVTSTTVWLTNCNFREVT